MASDQSESAESDITVSAWNVWLPPGIIAVGIFLLSSTPGAYFPRNLVFTGSIVHLLEFTLLAFMLARALYLGRSLSGGKLFLITTAICITFGLIDEAHQFLIPERMFDLKDLFFDSVGSAIGSMTYITAASSMKNRRSGVVDGSNGAMDDR